MTKEEVLRYIEENYARTDFFEKIPENLKNDMDILSLALSKNSYVFSVLREDLRNNPEVLKMALESKNTLFSNPIKYALPGALTEENIDLALQLGGISTHDFSKTMLANKSFLIKYANAGNSVFDLFKRLPIEFKNDKEIVIALVKNSSTIFSDLSEEFRNDPEVFNAALTDFGAFTHPIKYALPGALTEENIDLALKNGNITTYSPAMLSSKSFLIKYLEKHSGYDLYKKLPEEFKNDRDIILPLLKNNGYLLRELSEEFRNDPEMLAAALSGDEFVTTNPLIYALPNALTEENIDKAIEVGRLVNLNEILLSNKKFLLKYLEKNSGYDLYNKLPEELKNDREIILALLHNNYYLFRNLKEEFRSDSEVLKMALENRDAPFYNPIIYAFPSALTDENIDLALEKGRLISQELSDTLLNDKRFILKYIEKGFGYDLYGRLSENFKNDKDVIRTLVKEFNHIFKELSEEFRNDPEILTAALLKEERYIYNDCPIIYALPNALTEANIDLVISRGFDGESEYLLDNRYYILRSIEDNPKIFSHASERLRNDKELINIALLFHPDLLYSVGSESLTDEMIEYALQKGLEINEKNIPDTILSSETFVTKFLPLYPSIYSRLPLELKAKTEYINSVLSKDINNLSMIPNEFITDEMLEDALKRNYSVAIYQESIVADYIDRQIKNNPDTIFDIFMSANDFTIYLPIMQAMNKNRIKMPENVKQKNDELLNKYIEKYRKCNINEEYINEFIRKVLTGEVHSYNMEKINSFKEMLYATNLGNLFADKKSWENRAMRFRPIIFSNVSYDTLMKTNPKQYNEIKKKLLDMEIDDFYSSEIAIGMYTTIGYTRSKDLLNGKYGPVNFDKLFHLFGDLDGSGVLYEQDNTKYKPILNEQLINLLFGSSYKVINTPIRNFLNGFGEMDNYIQNEIERVNASESLTEQEKQDKVKTLSNSYTKYCDDVREFIKHFSGIYSNWDLIEEEFLKKEKVSKLKIKLNIPQVNSILGEINKTRSTMRENRLYSKRKNNNSKIPGYQQRDFPLAMSDVFDYVGKDTQFITNPEQAPHRAVELSRKMENMHSKKFPNVNMDFGEYNIKVFNPQDRNIISAGFRSGCCFRPNGNADNNGRDNGLLTYCTSTEYGGGLEIRNSRGKTLMFTPILRNGNVLMLHSFESIGLSSHEVEVCNEILKQWSKEVLKVSKEEEKEEAIVAVAMTDLHPKLDTTKCRGTLPDGKKFKVYNPSRQFDRMYTNLEGNNHYVIDFADGKGVNDISYNFEVSKSYNYPNELFKVKAVSVLDDELSLIEQIIDNKNSIVAFSNKRKESEAKKEELEGFELLKQIKAKQKENLELQKKLYSINPDSKKDTLTEYIEARKASNSVCDQLGITRKAVTMHFRHIFYSEGWYLGITRDNKLYGDCIKGFEQEYFYALNDVKNNYGLTQEIEININNDITGGPRR